MTRLPHRSPYRGIHGSVVAHVGQRIIRGDIPPGEPIDPLELEHELGVSRTVVREALRVLSAKGMVDARPKRGTYVRPREDWSLLDGDVLRWQVQNRSDDVFLANLAEVRGIVEPAGARLAAERRTEEDVETLRAALEVLADPEALADDVIEADLAFHRTLLFSAHNELLQQMELVIETGLQARDLLVHGQGTWADSVPAHRAVYEAVAAGAVDAAERAVRDLLEQADRDVRELRDAGQGGSATNPSGEGKR
ncbi:DNA-binding FadR family transcriptional regulator [Haloactinopolyspora alba]|uniref:DNA-binding FadR family transcriptional regulator n=1 Tax=Haloactinopolyspora alba TaxID=648780 RepID=A0A2P8EG93_9ACTN|nr:FadR/GntR family transcriptional regulator [Haloactinopolyspora alba]PSL08486.1 DNA-binding FadR family transcriptional regulator [Haloactinopolyspora alba]